MRNISKYFRKSHPKQSGFTLLELLVVSMLAAGVVTTTAKFWRTISLSMSDLNARSKTAEELRFVMQNISNDFGSTVGVSIFEIDRFLICRDSGKNPNGVADWDEPDVIIEYFLTNKQVHRFNQSSGLETVVADGVSSFEVEQVTDSEFQISIALTQDNVTRSAVFFWSDS
jgi:prepilin-type N-terminal cleavage/methylation domain-containing protein